MPSKIIIVEDSKEILRGVTRTLDEVGYIVVGASDGCEGLEVIRENQVLQSKQPWRSKKNSVEIFIT